jgi:hypothetical protein
MPVQGRKALYKVAIVTQGSQRAGSHAKTAAMEELAAEQLDT